MSENKASKSVSLEHISQYISAQIEKAAQKNIRLPILIEGDSQAINMLCDHLANLLPTELIARVSSSDGIVNNYYGKNANHVIGKEFHAVFFQFNACSDPNLFAALAGTVRGGGIFVCCIERAKTISSEPGLFEHRTLGLLRQSPCLKIAVEEHNNYFYSDTFDCVDTDVAKIDNYAQQNAAIDKIIQTATGRAHRPLVLTAQRGRGKSAALGIACARLLNQTAMSILITAPSLAAATVLFKHYRQNVTINKDHLQFVAPDELAATLPEARLMIIDEAAALPTPLLKKFLDNYSRVVFATTTHGYEGSGQSFAIRFKQYLQLMTPDWKAISLETPIRWSAQDPLEPIINQLFLLSTPTQNLDASQFNLDNCHFFQVTSSELVKDEALLQQVTSLLQFSHYKTRPSDLKQLLNNPEYRVFIALHNASLAGVALGICEGPMDIDIARTIFQGKRRPVGELIPQTLIFHLKHFESYAKRYLRLTRIAVHPDYQRKGVGTALLKQVEQYARAHKFAAIGSSFGATPELLRFWMQQDYTLVRIGHTRNASSAMHSAMVLKNLSAEDKSELENIHQRFIREFEFNLTESLKILETEIVHCVLHFSDLTSVLYPAQCDWQSVYNYAFLNHNYEDCLPELHVCLHFALSNSIPGQQDYGFLIEKILQRHGWDTLTRNFHFRGKKQTELELRAAFAKLIIKHATFETKSELRINNLNES